MTNANNLIQKQRHAVKSNTAMCYLRERGNKVRLNNF